MKSIFYKNYKIMAIIIFGLSVNFMAIAGDNLNSDQITIKMEQHWDKLMSEKNPDKRKKLAIEHRSMMDKALKQSGISNMGMMHNSEMNAKNDHHHSHMVNTMQMHYIQLDMME